MKNLLAWLMTLVMAGAAWAGTPKVSDEGGFFSAGAVSKANQRVEQIKRDYGKDVVIETFATIPDDQKPRYSEASKAAFFHDWAWNNAKREGVDGIYLLICKTPAHLQVEVGKNTAKAAFTVANRDHLRDVLVGDFREKKFDQGLSDALDYIDQTLKANGAAAARNADENAGTAAYSQGGARQPGGVYPGAPARTRPNGGGWGWLWVVIIIVGVLFLLRWVMRLVTGASSYGYGNRGYGTGGPPPVPPRGYGYGGGGYSGGSGGGFGRGLLGGLLGGAAGGYLYDRWSHRNPDAGGATAPPPPADQGAGGSWGDQPMDTGGGDFSGPSSDMGAGGDFGGDPGGGFDSGGGGGGDSGGGGDF